VTPPFCASARPRIKPRIATLYGGVGRTKLVLRTLHHLYSYSEDRRSADHSEREFFRTVWSLQLIIESRRLLTDLLHSHMWQHLIDVLCQIFTVAHQPSGKRYLIVSYDHSLWSHWNPARSSRQRLSDWIGTTQSITKICAHYQVTTSIVFFCWAFLFTPPQFALPLKLYKR
jgi:hypothetical protein